MKIKQMKQKYPIWNEDWKLKGKHQFKTRKEPQVSSRVNGSHNLDYIEKSRLKVLHIYDISFYPKIFLEQKFWTE